MLNRCYGFCEVETSQGYNLRQETPYVYIEQPAEQAGSSVQRGSTYAGELWRRERQKEISKRNYDRNILYKKKNKVMSTLKYSLNAMHRQKVKGSSKMKYSLDVVHKEKLKEMSIRKYTVDLAIKEKVREMSIRTYRVDVVHKEKVKERSRKNHANVKYKQRVVAGLEVKRQQLKENAKQFDVVMQKFLHKVLCVVFARGCCLGIRF